MPSSPGQEAPITEPKIVGRALVFTYRRLSRFFHEVADRTFAGDITYCSAWPGLEEVNLQTHFYKCYAEDERTSELSDEEYDEIITRSCVLRLVPRPQATRMVTAMYRVIDALTDRSKPDYLLSVTVDNYMTDLLVRICVKKGARPLTFVAGPVDNTILMTRYGEFNKVREPDESEVDAALGVLLDDTARVTYGRRERSYNFWRQARIFSVWWAKCLFFRASGWVRRDPLNFRYLMGSLPARDGQSSLWGYRCTRFFDHDWAERIDATDKPAFFIPLSYTPEASVSYWLRDTRYIDYENFILDLCAALRNQYLVVIKEHWAALGARRWPFYERLKAISGVVIVPAQVNSRDVMRRVERVLVGAGTAGIEAALRGKRVVTLDRPYYHVDGHFLTLGSAARIRELPALLESFRVPPATELTRRQIVRRVLQTTVVGHMLPDDRIDREENFSAVSKSLKAYLSRVEA